ncbi:MAG: TrmB family transcriptional regulator [Candidatus Thorarchaeota archaeon]
MKYEEILKNVGLTSWESKTYLALLELGSTTTGSLVKKCEVPQSKIYGVLESLNNKGLVSHIVKGKLKYFQAAEPDKILSIIKNKQKEVKDIIQDLKKLATLSKSKQIVEVYEGIKSIMALFIDLFENVDKNDSWRSFGYVENEISENAHLFWDKIGVIRHEKLKDIRLLNNIADKEIYLDVYKDRWKYMKKIIRFSKQIFPTTTILFKEKIIFLNFLSQPETAIVITSKNLFDTN